MIPACQPHWCLLETIDSNGEYSCFARDYDLWCPFANDAGLENYDCRSGRGIKAEAPATHSSTLAPAPDVKARIVGIMTVAAHCKDRTYGEVADEIITFLSRPHTPAAENPFNLPNPYCPEHTGFRDNSGDIKPLPFIYARNGYYYCSKCLDKLFEQYLREREGAKSERENCRLDTIRILENLEMDTSCPIPSIHPNAWCHGKGCIRCIIESLRAQPEEH